MDHIQQGITVIHGSQELQKMTIELLETVELAKRIPKGSRICLKPNLVVSRPADEGATTHPDIVEGTILYLQDHGFTAITIAEGSWVGETTKKAFNQCGYTALSKKHQVPLIDTQKIGYDTIYADAYALNICDCMRDFDVLINMPVLKGHCQTWYTGALKNLKGCIPDTEKRRFHSEGLHEPIARLNTVIKQDFIIMDGICGDPTFEEGGSPSDMHRILFCSDPVLIDSYAVSLLGMKPGEVPYITRAAELGVGKLYDRADELREINEPESKESSFTQNPILKELASQIDQRDACSSCYANLIEALRQTKSKSQFVIGRAFRDANICGNTEDRIGVGNCTFHCRTNIKGCPPSVEDIINALT